MCQCKILHCDTSGYVAYCSNCRYIQFGFDTMVLSLLESEFEDLYTFASKEFNKNKECEYTIEKCFVYHTSTSFVRLIFSLYDLERLYNLLSPSRIMLQVYNLTSAG